MLLHLLGMSGLSGLSGQAKDKMAQCVNEDEKGPYSEVQDLCTLLGFEDLFLEGQLDMTYV